jgi:GT2 family glycosyltransferase
VTDRSFVAIPAHNEADRICACLYALGRQTRLPDRVILLVNNCADATGRIARDVAPRLRFPLDVVEVTLPAGKVGAGHARCQAMAIAARDAHTDDLLLTTDADALVPIDWIERNHQAFTAGAQVVCGQAVIDVMQSKVQTGAALEARLNDLLDRIAWDLDPEPHDPPPRHREASGASLALSVAAYRLVGGVPDIASGEDRALVHRLWQMDARIRHDPQIQVVVSGRTVGRACNGMADTLRRRGAGRDVFTDQSIEPVEDAARRYRLRRTFREAWLGERMLGYSALAPSALSYSVLGISPVLFRQLLARPYFGEAWTAVEAASPLLVRRRVRFADLPAEIAEAEAQCGERDGPAPRRVVSVAADRSDRRP